MIVKSVIGKGFAGCVNYVGEKEQAEVLHVEGVRSDPKEMIQDFNFQASARPDLGNKVWHASFSFDHADKVTPEMMKEIGESYAQKFGIDQYAIIRHNDTLHAHFHLVGNRVKSNGQTVSDQFNYKRNTELARRVEQRFNLVNAQTKGKDLSKTNIPKLNRPERARIEIYKAVQTELKGSKSLEELQSKLKPHGIQLQPHSNSAGVYGVSFKQGNLCFKGSQLGKDMTAKALEKTFAAALSITPIAPLIKAVSLTKNLGKDNGQGMGL